MAQLRRISDTSFNIKERVLLCGKGPSSDEAHKALGDKHLIAAINTAVVFFDHVDFLFFNDIETINNIRKYDYDLRKIKNIICPIQLHQNDHPSGLTYLNVLEQLQEHSIDVYTYKLHTQTIPSPECADNDEYRNIISSASTAINWLTSVGFRNFDIYGIDTQGDYSHRFKEQSDCGNTGRNHDWYAMNYKSCIDPLIAKDCQYTFNK